ncbi:hypothetical protein [uncultured Pontibacter sp.]|uniref:hypothetical protein n=1 Tax=uncultured Pontibacter sp. TaxID=453356 RepID=UPI00262C6F6E|nr:hypothetical protein [uncultured Pontibacter sp.]
MKTVGIVILVLVTVAGLFFLVAVNKLSDSMEPTFSQVELVSKEDSSKLYITSKNWGVTGDRQITIISLDEEKEFKVDSTSQIMFHGLEPFLYQVRTDSLILFVRQKAKIPVNFKTDWVIIQNEIENPKMMTLRANPAYKRM